MALPKNPEISLFSESFELIRAFALFTVLFSVLVVIGVDFSFRVLDLDLLNESLGLGRTEARKIAQAVELVGGAEEGTLDFSQVRRDRGNLQRFIRSRIQNKSFIDHVEVFDRFGVRQLLVLRERTPGEPLTEPPGAFVPPDWPQVDDQVVTQALVNSQGEIRLALTPGPILDEVVKLRNSLRRKVMIAAGLAAALMIAGLLYVLYLIRRNRILEQSRQSAARASYVGLLASGLAHEIRNPLNAMNMNLQMLEEELHANPASADEEHLELLDSTKSEIKRLERLVNNFLTYARPQPPRFDSRDLSEVVSEVVRLLEADFRQSGVILETDLAPVLPRVEIDDAQFKQALINLLVNARQILKNDGTVRVITRAGAGGELVLEVQDNGPGVPLEVRDRIFEVFYSNRGGGTGLGLPIARQVVERHGGTIELDSELGKGTTFRIRIPRRQRAAIAEAPQSGALT